MKIIPCMADWIAITQFSPLKWCATIISQHVNDTSVFLRKTMYRATVHTDLEKGAIKNCLNTNAIIVGRRSNKNVFSILLLHFVSAVIFMWLILGYNPSPAYTQNCETSKTHFPYLLSLWRIQHGSALFAVFLCLFVCFMSISPLTCTATTERTSTEILLNSSKQPQAPVWERPL